jgi:type VI secretion system protein ImpA
MTETLAVELPPIAEDAPCGPDLDLEGDPDFMNFFAEYEGLLPANSYFEFDRETLNFPAALAAIAKLRPRTQDLRLGLMSAKLLILNRDFYGFAREVAEVAWLLANRWDEAHPQAERGKFTARLAQLSTLNDGPSVVMPLQYATLLQGERESLSYRAVMVAAGDAKLREGEKLANAGAIERMINTIDIAALVKAHATLSRLAADLETITAITLERVGGAGAVKFDALAPLVAKMLDWAQGVLAKRDPTLAPAPAAAEGDEPSGAASGPSTFETLADVDSALASALGYFLNREPSSPALLLIAQARATLGKNLYDVMRLLAPRHADNARVFVGSGDVFSIPVSSLQDAPALDFSPGEAEPAPSRVAAFALIEQVAAHLRQVEPSSPAPYLLDRARALATRDFLSLLTEVFPSEDLESMKNGS